MKNSKPNTLLRGAVYVVVILLAVVAVSFSVAYHTWTSRGDVIVFSPTGGLGVGNTPLWATDPRGKKIQYGVNHNFLFVRDVAADKSMINALR